MAGKDTSDDDDTSRTHGSHIEQDIEQEYMHSHTNDEQPTSATTSPAEQMQNEIEVRSGGASGLTQRSQGPRQPPSIHHPPFAASLLLASLCPIIIHVISQPMPADTPAPPALHSVAMGLRADLSPVPPTWDDPKRPNRSEDPWSAICERLLGEAASAI